MNIEEWLKKFPGRYGIYAKDLTTNAVVAHHERESFPSASTIKVPIMAEVYRRFEEEHASLDHMLPMCQEDQVGGSGVLQDLAPGTSLTVRNLTTLMITVSDNTATNLLIDYLGLDAINQMIKRLEMQDTELVRRLQRLPAQRSDAVNRTTAYDLSLLMDKLARGQCVSEVASEHMVATLSRCQGMIGIAPSAHPSRFVGQKPAVTVAHKTGSLEQACHDAGIVYFLGGRTYVATILSQGAPYDQLARTVKQIGRNFPRWLR